MSRVASSLIALTRVGIGRFWLSSAIYFAGRDSLMLKSCFRKSSWSIGFDIYDTSLWSTSSAPTISQSLLFDVVCIPTLSLYIYIHTCAFFHIVFSDIGTVLRHLGMNKRFNTFTRKYGIQVCTQIWYLMYSYVLGSPQPLGYVLEYPPMINLLIDQGVS